MNHAKTLTTVILVVFVSFGLPEPTRGAPLSLASGSLTVSSDTTYEGGIIGTSGAPTLTINGGITATFAAGHSLLYGTGGRWNLKGSGTFLNLGTLVYTNIANVGLSWQGSSATFVNEGLVDFVGQSVNGGLYWYDANGKFINTNGGVIQVSRAYTYRIQNGGYFSSYDGTIRVTNNGTLWFDNSDYYITNTTFETYGTGWIRIRRSPELVDGTASGKALLLPVAGASAVRFGRNPSCASVIFPEQTKKVHNPFIFHMLLSPDNTILLSVSLGSYHCKYTGSHWHRAQAEPLAVKYSR